MLPFSQQQFVEVFSQFNDALWPLQLVALTAGVVCVSLLLLDPASNAGRMILVTLAVMWVATGVVYHGLYFSRINEAAYSFAAAFVLQGLALAWVGVRRRPPRIEMKRDLHGALGMGFIVYALVVYPLWALVRGTPYLETPSFGLTPCPLVLFTWGFLLLARPAARALTIIPLVWSIIGVSAAWWLEMPQDLMLAVGAAAGGWLLLAPRKRTEGQQPHGALVPPASA